jgi:hypothetical protein
MMISQASNNFMNKNNGAYNVKTIAARHTRHKSMLTNTSENDK